MGHTLSSIQLRLSLVVAGSVALSPIVAYGVAIFFGVLSPAALLEFPSLLYLSSAYLALIVGAGWYFYRYSEPLLQWCAQNNDTPSLPASLSEHLGTFSTRYWLCFVLAALLLPLTHYGTALLHAPAQTLPAVLQFILLQWVIAIYIGMPGYLQALTSLGKLTRHIGLPAIQVSMRTKMLLIGAYLPILTTLVVLSYYWWRTAYLSGEVLFTCAAIALLATTITAVAIHGLEQALAPVKRVISRSGASSYKTLIQQLRPQSLDEIGYLTQLLGNLFRRLSEQESHVSAIVDNSAEGIIVLDASQAIDIFNPAAEALFGYQSHEIRGKPLRWLFPGFDVSDELQSSQNEVEVYGRHRNGASVPMSVRCSQMQRDEQTYYTLLVADISQRKAAERQLLEAEARYRNLVETAHDLVWSMDQAGNWTYLNNAASEIYGYTADDMLGHHYAEYQAAESGERDATAFEQVLAGKELFQYETIHLDADGNRHYISFNARPTFNESGEVLHISGTARDITEQKRFEQELTYQAQHDKLTGLYNRNYFQSELERVISRIARSAAECALLYLDLDQFKYVNDTLGHAAGDRLLKECTEMLRKNVREGDLLARFGGDEFTVLLYNIDHSHALPVAQNIRAMFEHYKFMDSGKTFNVTCSIGLTMIDSDTSSADEALSRADLACNISKSQGRNCVHEYSEGDGEQSVMAEDMGWAARVRDAIDNDRFQVLYQPIVSLKSHQVHAYEVLLRLPTDDGKTIKPGGFIPAAERFGLIQNIDRWIVRQSLTHLAELHDNNVQTQFSINLSGRAVDDPELLPLIQGLLRDSGLNPAALSFELTEEVAIANLQAVRRFINQLKDLGCHVSLDDFGSGFCSFTYLKHLPVDSLKIDGSFIQGLTHTKVDQAMVQSMNQIAHALGKTTIAEAVENGDTWRLLQEYGIDFAQGHFLGRPRSTLWHSFDGDCVRDAPLSA
ncbi:MAG: EAL domain-containing protein [Gammaproteobacteria bacterium]|nr:EAL domain-containing protein [Gammaproteobacteria bacterium]